MCLAQGPQHSDACEAGTCRPSVPSQALYHCATALPGHPFNQLSSGTRNLDVGQSFHLLPYFAWHELAVMALVRPGLRLYKKNLAQQLSMKFIILINVKMPTIVGILTFISMINNPSESLKAREIFIFQRFSFYEGLIFMLS